MSFNPAASYTQGLQMGRQNKIAGLKNALAGQMQQQGFNPQQSEEFNQLLALDPEYAGNAAKTFNALEDNRKKAFFQDAQSGLRLLQAGDEQGFLNLANNRLEQVDRLKGDPSDVIDILQTYHSGDIDGTVQKLQGVVQGGISTGFLKDPLERQIKEAKLAQLTATKPKSLTDQEKATLESDKEFRKEERQVAKTSITNFNKRSTEIRSSYKKVESILGSGKLNRMKIASAMTSMARLLSPGIVTNQDFQSLSNSASPIAELLSKLTGKGEQGANIAENLQRFYDPTNPDLFDKESFLETARNVAGAEIPSIIDSFDGAKDRAVRAGISQRALNANFNQNKNYSFLKAMQQDMSEANKPVVNHSTLGDVTEKQIQEAMKNKNMTRDQVIALLNEGQ